MAERNLIVENVSVSYSGLFDVREFYKVIDDWLKAKGYDKVIVKHKEYMTETGKNIEILMAPYKKVTDYIKNYIKMWIGINNVKEVEVKKGKTRVKINKGEIMVVLDGWLELDYEHRWEQKPMFFFLRILIDKFIHRSEIDKYGVDLINEISELHDEIKSFLGLYKYGPSVKAKVPGEAPARY